MCDSAGGRSKMFCRLLFLVFFGSLCWSPADSRVIQKRAASFYIANETMCIVDGEIYRNGDPVPTDDECERCTCRPPGFSCVLRDCDTKPGCKAVRKVGECCPEYVCGCVHNSRVYEDGELIRDLQNNCYTCRCHGSSISCTFADCHFRGDCPPEYIPGECCPRYDHCPPASTTTTTTTTTTEAPGAVQEEIEEFINFTTQHLGKFTSEDVTVTVQDIITDSDSYFTTSSDIDKETLFTVKFTLSGEKISSIKDYDSAELTTILPQHPVSFKETTRYIVTPPGSELSTLKSGLVPIGFETTTSPPSSTTQTAGVSDTELTVQDLDIYSTPNEILAITESEKPEDVTEHDGELAESDNIFISTSGDNKITTFQEEEISTFDSDSRFSTVKEDGQLDSLRPAFVTAGSEETNETTSHEQDVYSKSESPISISTDDNSSQDSNRVPVLPHEDLTTSTEYSEISTSSDISVDESFDSQSLEKIPSNMTDNVTDDEITAELTETEQSTELSTHGDLQTSDDDLQTVEDSGLSNTLHSTILDSDNSTADSESLSSEYEADHETQTTEIISAEEQMTTHGRIFTSTDIFEHTTSNLSGDTTHPSLNTADITAEILDKGNVSSEADSSGSTEMLDSPSTSDSDSSTFETSSLKTEESAPDHISTVGTEETGSTVSDIIDTTTDPLVSDISSEELDALNADVITSVQQSYSAVTGASTLPDHHLSSSSEELSTVFHETQSTISNLLSVSSEQDLTTDFDSFTKGSEISASTTDADLLSLFIALMEEENGTSFSTDGTETTAVINAEFTKSKDEDTSAYEETTKSETEHKETESEDLSHESDASTHISSSELAESEESFTSTPATGFSTSEAVTRPSPSFGSEGEESDSESLRTAIGEKTGTPGLEDETLHPLDTEVSAVMTESSNVIETSSMPTASQEQHSVSMQTIKIDITDDHDAGGYTGTERETTIDSQTTHETTSQIDGLTNNTTENDKSAHSVGSIDLNGDANDSLYLAVTPETITSADFQTEVNFPHTATEDFLEGEISKDEIDSSNDILETDNDTEIVIKEEHQTTVRQKISPVESTAISIEDSQQVTSSDEHKTDGDSPSKVTDISSSLLTEETESSEVNDTDDLNVKHESEAFANKDTARTQSVSVEVTSLKPITEQSPSTSDDYVPSENPVFEPPLANILKQSMLFNRPFVQKKNSSVSVQLEEIPKGSNFSSNSSDENQIVRLSLTLAEDDKENANNTPLIHEDSENTTLIHQDSENKILVLNHDYTISDSEVNYVETSSESDDEDNNPEESEDSLTSVTTENGERDDQTITVSSSDKLSTAQEQTINPIIIYNENDESVPLISGTEVLDSEELLTETTENENITSETTKDLHLLSDTLETHSLSHDQKSPNVINIQNVENNLSEGNSTDHLSITFSPETSETAETPSSITQNDNDEISSDASVPVSTDTVVINIAQSQSTGHVVTEKSQYESTPGKEIDDVADEDIGVGSQVLEHTFATTEENNDNTSERVTEINEANAESNSYQFDHTTNDQLISTERADGTENSDLLQENYNDTYVDYSYHDAETSKNPGEGTETPTPVSISDLDPEMITALKEISTSLVANVSDTSNYSSVNEEYDYPSTTTEDKESYTHSTVKINILFGQNSPDTLSKTTETDLSVTRHKDNSNLDLHFSNEGTFPHSGEDVIKSDETSTIESLLSELDQDQNEHSHSDDTELSNTPSDQTKSSQEGENDVDFSTTLNADSDSGETTSHDLEAESSVKLNSANFSDEVISPEVSSIASKNDSLNLINDSEESSSPFTILEYIGDLFSGFTTFSTISNSNEAISTRGVSEISNEETNLNNTSPSNSASEANNSTLSPDQSYSSKLKNQFAEYGSLGGVFITGQSKYNKTLSNEKAQEPSNDALDHVKDNVEDDETSSNVTDYSDVLVHHNSEIHINTETETETDSEDVHFATEEFSLNAVSLNTVGDNRQDVSTDDTLSEKFSSTTSEENFEQNEKTSSLYPGTETADDTFTTKKEIRTESGPEKGGEWFEPLDPALSQENNENEGTESNSSTLPDNKESDNIITTEIPPHHGPEKGGDVFEPSFPEIFPIGSAKVETNNEDISNNTDDEGAVTDNVVSKMEESTQNNDISTSNFPSSTPESVAETSTNDPFKSEFIPPLPILLKSLIKSEEQHNSTVNVMDNANNTRESISNIGSGHLSAEEGSFRSPKVEYARNIDHPYPFGDVITRVFKAPGYDSEIHLSPWRAASTLKKSHALRVKRDTKEHPEKDYPTKNGDFSTTLQPNNNPASSTRDDVSPVNSKNILLVEGYGYKPATFFPVTSSFIIVHSDEDSEDNEAGVDSRQKTVPSQPKAQISKVEFLDEIPPESSE